jgi:hypothetical protein
MANPEHTMYAIYCEPADGVIYGVRYASEHIYDAAGATLPTEHTTMLKDGSIPSSFAIFNNTG